VDFEGAPYLLVSKARGPSCEAQCVPAKESATMALDQSALSELLDALRAGGDLDVVREALALML
jgi:hypothetical protein